MNATRVLSTAILFLLPGAIATAYAQEHEQEKKPEQKQQQAKPAKQEQQAKPAKQQAAHQDQAKPAKQQAARQEPAKPAEKQAKPEKQPQQAAHQQQAKPAQHQQRAQGQQQAASRGPQTTGSHGSIPDAKFRASFGSSHTFHVNQSEFANGSGRFQYGGFWFNAVNPWPVGWLYTDAVYVDFLNGGYFLCDPFHPGIYLSINVAI